MKHLQQLVLVAATTTVLFGCVASPVREVRESGQKAVEQVAASMHERSSVVEIDKPLVLSSRIPYVAPSEKQEDINVDAVPLRAILSRIASKRGWSVAYAKVNPDVPVTAEIKGLKPSEALRELAFRAGYVALFESDDRIVIADRGSMTLRVPFSSIEGKTSRHAMSNSLQDSNGGQAGSGAGTSGGEGTSNGARNSITSKAQAAVTGTTSYTPESLRSAVHAIMGENSTVSVFPAASLITITGDARQLRRAKQFLDKYAISARTMIELKTAVIEVSLNDEFRFGIDWARVVPLDRAIPSGIANLRLQNARIADAPLITQVTTQNISAVIQALGSKTKLKVVSRPEMLMNNGVWTIWRDASSVPYIGEIKSNVSGTSGTVTSSATITYAQDGVSLSAIANVLDGDTIDVTLMPIISSISGFTEFRVGDTRASAPTQPVKEGVFPVTAPNGKTLIVAGSRIEYSSEKGRGVPGTQSVPALNLLFNERNDADSAKELFFLLQARIVPPSVGAIVVMESL